MSRISVMFAVASAVFVLAGLLLPIRSGVSIHFGGVVIVLGGRECCLIYAAFLCTFAAVYSLWMLPLNLSAAHWHVWITASSALAFVIFFLLSEQLGVDNSARVWTALLFEFFSGMTFVAGLAIFLVNLTQAVYKLAHVGLAPRIT